MVTINKILFRVMDDRGSKSAISLGIALKEQRVYGYKYLHNKGKILKMYSNELRYKLWKKKFYTKNLNDSPLNGSNSLNVNTRRYYVTLSNNKHKIDDLHIGP